MSITADWIGENVTCHGKDLVTGDSRQRLRIDVTGAVTIDGVDEGTFSADEDGFVELEILPDDLNVSTTSGGATQNYRR